MYLLFLSRDCWYVHIHVFDPELSFLFLCVTPSCLQVVQGDAEKVSILFAKQRRQDFFCMHNTMPLHVIWCLIHLLSIGALPLVQQRMCGLNGPSVGQFLKKAFNWLKLSRFWKISLTCIHSAIHLGIDRQSHSDPRLHHRDGGNYSRCCQLCI